MNVQLSSVIISEDKVEQIRAAISQLEHHKTIFEEWGFEDVFEKGTAVSILFHGIPGTGKTLMAQAIADSLKMSLRIIGTADIETSEPGGAERTIKKVFQIANVRIAREQGMTASVIQEKYGVDIYNDPEEMTNPLTGETTKVAETERLSGKPQVLLFDECDSLLMDRNSVGVILAAQINTLLQELERFQGVVIFTTNRLGKLDPALERRIAAKIEFEFPDKSQRRAIWRRMIPMRAPIADDVVLEELADFPLVGGNIKNAVLNAARDAAYKGLKQITKECFVQAIEKEIEGLQQFLSSYEQDSHINRVKKATEEMSASMNAAGGLQIQTEPFKRPTMATTRTVVKERATGKVKKIRVRTKKGGN